MKRYSHFIIGALLVCLSLFSGCCKEKSEYKDEPRELEAVDLGLPSGTLWASQNLLADRPWAPGPRFRWGETQPGGESKDYCFLSDGKLTKYNFDETSGVVDNRYILEPEDDAATAILGDGWRLPTRWEFEELRDCCHWEKEKIHGQMCYIVSSKINANYIIVPNFESRQTGISALFEYHNYCVYWTNCVVSDVHLVRNGAWILKDGKPSLLERTTWARVRPVYAGRAAVEGIRIELSDNSKPAGTKERMKVAFTPAGALDKRVEWKSSADSVAFIDSEGSFVALFPGEAQILATSPSSGLTAEAEVVVTEYVVPEKIDLGLPSGILWADRNLGAINKEDFGLKFCWGATRPRATDQEDRNSYLDFSPEKDAYSDGVLSLDYDAANVILGGGWRIPTREDFQELKNNSVRNAFSYTSNYNGRTLDIVDFLYWTSTHVSDKPSWGYSVAGLSDGVYSRYSSKAAYIRPVFDPELEVQK